MLPHSLIHPYPRERTAFYSSSSTATLNVTRDAMRRYCGCLDHVLEPNTEGLLAEHTFARRAEHLEQAVGQWASAY
jgi:hypothetical protein